MGHKQLGVCVCVIQEICGAALGHNRARAIALFLQPLHALKRRKSARLLCTGGVGACERAMEWPRSIGEMKMLRLWENKEAWINESPGIGKSLVKFQSN